MHDTTMHDTTMHDTATPRGRTVALVMACVGAFVAYLPVTSVAVALPAIQRALGGSTADLSWVSDAFVLPMGALILTAGVVGAVAGLKKVYLAGLMFSAAGAAVALSAHSIQVVWAGQALSGVGAAALLPTTLALVTHAVPDPRERGKFVGLWATALLAPLAAGPFVSGLIMAHVSWRWIFLPAIPAALAAMAVAARLLADSRAPGSRRLDWPGQVTAALAITSLVYGVIEGGAGSFGETRVIVALVLAAASGAAFVVTERRSSNPMLDLRLFSSPGFTATTVVAMISFLSLIGVIFTLSLYLGQVQQLSTLQAATRMLMVTSVPLVAGVPVGRLMNRVSVRLLIPGGLLIAAGALLSMMTANADTSFGQLAWRLLLLGLGLGLVTTPMTATAVSSVPYRRAGMAAAGNSAFRQVGSALGPAILGALLTSRAVSTLPGHIAGAGLGRAQEQAMTAAMHAGGFSAVGALHLGPDYGRAMGALSSAFLDGFHLALLVSAALAVLAALVAVILLPRSAARFEGE